MIYCHRHCISLSLLCLSIFFTAHVRADETAANSEIFKQKGFKLAGNVLFAPEEADVERSLNQLKTLLTALLNAKQRLTGVENAAEGNRQAIKQLKFKLDQLALQLQVPNMTTASRNAVVAQYNSLADQIKTRIEIDEKGVELAKANELYSVPRNAYLKAVIALRDLIDTTDAKYKKAGSDKSLEAAINAASKTDGKAITLGPTKNYQQLVKTFASYEARIMSDKIPLIDDNGTYRLDVILNGKNPVKMVFDTGASTVSLSHEMAVDAGVKANDPSMEVTVRIANGDKVKARMVKLASVRVGKFELKNVDCIVMPKDAPSSPPLLGGSYLNSFKYEVDREARKLRLVRIESGNSKSPGK